MPDEDVDRAIERIAEQQRKTEVAERPAESGDIIVVDVEGRSGEQEIPGASGKDRQITLGSGGFIPGFEEQLIGAGAGDHRTVRVTFPEDYGAPDFAGKDAVFEVDVKEVRQRLPVVVDDELGKAVGLESLAELRQEVRQQMQRDYEGASRLRLKRSLLDKLAQSYDFAVPPGMVELEFDNIWRQYEAEKARAAQPEAASQRAASDGIEESRGEAVSAGSPETAIGEAVDGSGPSGAAPQPDDEVGVSAPQGGEQQADTTEDEEALKADYRKIAERRVRLGLLLAEVGRNNNINVTQDELNQAMTREARRHPGYERQVLDFYRQNPEAVANLRAPIFEDKVVDFIVELANVEERKISPRDLLTLPDPDASGPDTSGPDISGPDTSGPDTSGPDTSGPDTSGPDTSGPDTSGPDTSGPDTSGPDTSGPDTSGPDTSGPDTSGPDTSGPDTSGPDTSGPDTSGPDTSGPDRRASGPDTSGPDTSGPDTSGPDTSGPDTSGPDTSGPDTSGPDTSGPDTSGPDTSGPDTSGPDAIGPDASEAASD